MLWSLVQCWPVKHASVGGVCVSCCYFIITIFGIETLPELLKRFIIFRFGPPTYLYSLIIKSSSKAILSSALDTMFALFLQKYINRVRLSAFCEQHWYDCMINSIFTRRFTNDFLAWNNRNSSKKCIFPFRHALDLFSGALFVIFGVVLFKRRIEHTHKENTLI